MFFEWLFNTEYYKRIHRLELRELAVLIQRKRLHALEKEILVRGTRFARERQQYEGIIRRKDAEIVKLRANYEALIEVAAKSGICIVRVPCQS